MSESRIDALARSLASGTSRRGALRALFGGAAGSALALAGATVGRDVVVAAGVCCSEGQTICSGACVNTQTDVSNCGSCAHACAAGAGTFCLNGQCSSCASGATYCSGKCVNAQTDRDNCGQCGTSCGAEQGCIKGACVTCSSQIVGKTPVLPGMPMTVCNGTCVSLSNSNQNCGQCGKVCPAGPICFKNRCFATLCTIEAPPGVVLTDCGFTGCVDLATDPNNCGDCMNTCAGSAQICINGSCLTCPLDFEACNGECRNILRDTDNCGGCGQKCPSSNICSLGLCYPPGGLQP